MDHDRIWGSEVRLQCGKILILQCIHTIPATGGVYTLHKKVHGQPLTVISIDHACLSCGQPL